MGSNKFRESFSDRLEKKDLMFNSQFEDPVKKKLYSDYQENKLCPENSRLSFTDGVKSEWQKNKFIADELLKIGFHQAFSTGSPRDLKVCAVVDGNKFNVEVFQLTGERLPYPESARLLGSVGAGCYSAEFEFRHLILKSDVSVLIASLPGEVK